MLPPEPRLPGARDLVDEGLYFVVHAPRQTGKTTTLSALARDITAEGRQVALLFSCERARIYTDQVGETGRSILQAITGEAEIQGLPAEFMPPACSRSCVTGSGQGRGNSRRRSRCAGCETCATIGLRPAAIRTG